MQYYLPKDKDFGELVYRQGRVHMGVVLIRLSGLSTQAKVKIIVKVFANHENELLHAYSVITPGRVRIRKNQ